ncbi:TPA: hypothetical protein ACXRZU_000619 [Klebsiella pneumoniae]
MVDVVIAYVYIVYYTTLNQLKYGLYIMKVPSSFRFPDILMRKLKARAETKNTSLTEHVQKVLEASLEFEDFEEKHRHKLMENPIGGLKGLYEKIFSDINGNEVNLSLSEIIFILHYCYKAYNNNSGVVSLSYASIIATIISDLIKHSELMDIPYDKVYTCRCLNLSDERLENSLKEMLDSIKLNLDASYMEYISRPLENGAFNFILYNNQFLRTVFSKERLRALFPLMTKGVRSEQNECLSLNMHSCRETLSVSGMSFSIVVHGNELSMREHPEIYLVIEGGNFVTPLPAEKLLSILRVIEHELHSDSSFKVTFSELVKIYKSHSGTNKNIIDIDSFHILFSDEEYSDFVEKLTGLLLKKDISSAIITTRIMLGDI